MYLQEDYYDLVDVDSFGSDTSHLAGAIDALKYGGMLYLTSTDGMSAAGVWRWLGSGSGSLGAFDFNCKCVWGRGGGGDRGGGGGEQAKGAEPGVGGGRVAG